MPADISNVIRRPPTKWLIAIGCAVTLSFSATCGFVILDMRRGDYEAERIASVNLVATLANEVNRKVELIELSLNTVQQGLKLPDLDRIDPAIRNLILFDNSSLTQDFTTILVLDRDGNVRSESRSLTPREDNYAKREYFGFHIGSRGSETYISRPFVTKHGEYVIGFSRRLEDTKGGFDGVVVAIVRLRYFYNLLSNVELREGDLLTVMRTDGMIVMRKPFDISNIGRDISAARIFTEFRKSRLGSFETDSASDGVRRLFAYQQAGNSPLLVSSGRSADSMFTDWNKEAWAIGSIVFALCAFNMALVIFLARSLKQRSDAEHALERLASTDPLTGLCNRRRLDETFALEWLRGQRMQSPIALLMIDADLFKEYNDRCGHQAGDAALVTIAKCIEHNARRATDIAARYGGEEFAVLLPGTSVEDAHAVAERIRGDVLDLRNQQAGRPESVPTVSIGVAAMVPRAGLEPGDLMRAADTALYEAKAAGRNRCVAAVVRLVDRATRAA